MFQWFTNKHPVDTDEAKIDSLLTRGVDEVIHYDELKKKLLSGKQLRIKFGIDPTSPHLHLGRAVPLLKLRDFQDLGHHIVLVVGDETGVIGDTSDKESERPMLTARDVAKNMVTYAQQAGLVLDMSLVEVRKNSEWLGALTYSEIGDHANQFSVADFIARDNIKRRLDEGKRVSLREVLYPLMQGYDSVALQADVELGGTDQRFNLLAGRVLQQHLGQESQNILTVPLIEGTDGRKMSSSWGNTITLTDSPADMYAKIMKVDDNLMETYFTQLTRIPLEEIEQLMNANTTHPRDAKMHLAHDVTARIHSKEEAQAAQDVFTKTVQQGEVPEDMQTLTARDGELLVDVLVRESIVASKTEFKRLVQAGAVTHTQTGAKITDTQTPAQGGVYKVGKHRFVKLQYIQE